VAAERGYFDEVILPYSRAQQMLRNGQLKNWWKKRDATSSYSVSTARGLAIDSGRPPLTQSGHQAAFAPGCLDIRRGEGIYSRMGTAISPRGAS
jgi:hypothetical protein